MPARKKVVYPMLESEIARHGIKKYEIAETLGIKPLTLSKKLGGEIKFTLDEGLLIWGKWFSNVPMHELFRKNAR